MDGTASDRRQAQRARTRLNPGKLLSLDRAFLADCAILDRSTFGTRIRLCDEETHLPEEFVLFNETEVTMRHVSIVWRNGSEAGLWHESPAHAVPPAAVPLIAGPYYAVR